MIFPLPGSPFLYPILDSEFSSDLIGDAKQLIRRAEFSEFDDASGEQPRPLDEVGGG